MSNRESDIQEADTISVGSCDFCPAVHVNLRDRNGDIFATASVPIFNCEAFIANFRECMRELGERHSAPARRQ